jgi:hypothetical protein
VYGREGDGRRERERGFFYRAFLPVTLYNEREGGREVGR